MLFCRIRKTQKENDVDRALWITWYDLPDASRDAHLTWVHGTYIPKVLARRGFLWAAHYVSEPHSYPPGRLQHTAQIPAGNRYILLFGAEQAWAFAEPIPAKFHAALSEEDRNMLAMRSGERVNMFVEEARVDGPEVGQRPTDLQLSPCIQLGSFNAGKYQDEDGLMDWYAHCRMAAMGTLPGCLGVRKLVSVSGWAKHGVLYEFLSLKSRNDHFPNHERANLEAKAWSDRVVPTLVHAPGSPNVACRIWPPVK
jgi:hypothetical protein